jgi:hypothetical protein
VGSLKPRRFIGRNVVRGVEMVCSGRRNFCRVSARGRVHTIFRRSVRCPLVHDANRDRFVGFGVRRVSGVCLGGMLETVVAKVVLHVVGKHVKARTKSGRGR